MREQRQVYVSPAMYPRMESRFIKGSVFVGRRGQRSVFRWLAGEHYGHDPSNMELFLFFIAVVHPAFGGMTARDLFHQRFKRIGIEETVPLEIAA